LLPRSIGGRLALGAALLVVAALVVASVSTGFVLYRFIRGQIDQRLDGQIASLATILSSGGSMSGFVDAPPFDRPLAGWYWVVEYRGQRFASPSLAGGSIEARTARDRHGMSGESRPGPADGFGPRGEPLHMRIQTVPVNGDWAMITASAPGRALVAPLRDALVPVVVSMLVLGLLLGLASVVQLRLGLRPLARLRRGLQDVRTSRADRLIDDQPLELRPLVDELNSLLAQNAEGLKRARGHVANMGHALNTPLASLALSVASEAGPTAEERARLVAEMQARIRHHLGRARAAALGGPANARTEVKPHLADIASALSKIYADRAITIQNWVEPSRYVACEPQDLDEMLGNILDNAYKWARGHIAVAARERASNVEIIVEDDGPGIAADRLAASLQAGRKLDESAPGHGFGLAITRELAELYGGALQLEGSTLGGLKVTVELPGVVKT